MSLDPNNIKLDGKNIKPDPEQTNDMIRKIGDYMDKHRSSTYSWHYGHSLEGALYYDDVDIEEVNKILKECGISNFSGENGDRSNDLRLKLHKEDSAKIHELYKYLFCKEELGDLFQDKKYSMKILTTREEFANLHYYLNECFECIKCDMKIAATILLRCCVEIFINLFFNEPKTNSNSDDKTANDKKGDLNLNDKIKDFCNNLDTDPDFELLSFSKKEIGEFFTAIREMGNNAAHLKQRNVDEFIKEKRCNKQILTLLCFLIELSILKTFIAQAKAEDVRSRIKSTPF